MSEHRIQLAWSRNDQPFERNNYQRAHRVVYAGGQSINASSAVAYGGDAADVDPEQQLLGALASCHMLTFLAVAANRALVVDSYADNAEATLGKNAAGQMAVMQMTLRPRVRFSGSSIPTADEIAKLHERAHRACFIANSVNSQVTIDAQSD